MTPHAAQRLRFGILAARNEHEPWRLTDDQGDEAAGRALHAIEHPCITEQVWGALDDRTRTYWITRARPIAEAVRQAS